MKTFTLYRPITGLPYVTGYSPDEGRDVVVAKDLDPVMVSALMMGIQRLGYELKDTTGQYLVGTVAQLDSTGAF